MLQKLTKPSILIYLMYAVLIFIMSLIFATGLEGIMTQDNSIPSAIKDTREAVQSANNAVFAAFVVGIVAVALLYIFGNNYRRKLYLSNLVAGCAFPAVSVIVSVIAIINVISMMGLYNSNLEEIKNYYVNDLFGAKPVETLTYPIITLILLIGFVIYSIVYIVFTVLKFIKNSNRKVVVSDAK